MADSATQGLEAALQEAAEGNAPESAEAEAHTAENGQEAATAKGGDKSIPYPRFQEVVGERNSLREQLEAVVKEKEEAVTSTNNLTKLVDEYKQSADVVQELRDLADDEKYGPMVHALHNKIMGIEEELTEQAEAEGKDTSDPNVQAMIRRQSEKITEELENTQADLLAAKADSLADKWLDQLPEEYTDQDKQLVAELWNNRVDWDSVANNPDNLDAEMAKGLQESLDLYGTPRGQLVDRNEIDWVDPEKEAEQAAGETPEAKLREMLDNKNYSGFKEVQRGDKTVRVPEVSDDEFQADFARALKLAHSMDE